jgi:hypothetical protein
MQPVHIDRNRVPSSRRQEQICLLVKLPFDFFRLPAITHCHFWDRLSTSCISLSEDMGLKKFAMRTLCRCRYIQAVCTEASLLVLRG